MRERAKRTGAGAGHTITKRPGPRPTRRGRAAGIAAMVITLLPAVAICQVPPEADSISVFSAELERRGLIDAARAGSLNHRERVKVIRLVYGLLEKYAESDVSDLSFDLTDFQSIDAGEFSSLRYGDIITLTGGDVIDVSRRSHLDGNTGRKTVRYIPVWGTHPGPATQEEDGRRLDTMSIAEVLGAADEDPEVAGVNAATHYTVTVRLRGQSRTYRAAFFWKAWEAGSEIGFYAVDLITQGVPEAAVDPELTVSHAQAEPIAESSSPLFVQAQASTNWCDDFTEPDIQARPEKRGTSGHFSGKHYARPLFEHECSCDSKCVSRCWATVSPISCADKGFLSDGLCHKMTHGVDDSAYTVYSGTSQGARCSAGLGCAAKSCVLGCLCAGISVSVRAQQAGSDISFGSGALWTAKFSSGVSCAQCESLQSPPPSPPEADPTPIIIDLDRRGFRLTSAAGGVDFDIDADGETEKVSWTDGRSRDAFLARDRNGNGVIENGSELFGNFSPQEEAGKKGKNGFRALATLDSRRAGGNGDGKISAEDAASVLLLLWLDENHDGVSQRGEMIPLLERVSEISLDYRQSRRTDRYGNQFRLTSKARLADGQGTHAVDVTLLEEE